MMAFISTHAGRNALVLDSPHSGVNYPADFGYSCDLSTLRRAEDTHVQALYDFAPALGCAWVEAHFPRSYLDANRNHTEIDQSLLDAPWPGEIDSGAKVALGKGLIWRATDDGQPIYERMLSVAEVQSRITQCWRPYHAAVESALNAAHARHGFHIHINCHSMPAVASSHATVHPGLVHADFVLGDRDGTTANPELVERMRAHLSDLGYSVAVNHPYKGVELVRRYSDPQEQRHSIQLEINRRLYMDEQTLVCNAGFEPLKAHLHGLVAELATLDPRQL